MKASITSTSAVVDMNDCEGKPCKARVWEGVTANGITFTAYIAVVQVARVDDNYQFQNELSEQKAPETSTWRAIDLRYIL